MISCPRCKTELDPPVYNTGGLSDCPKCKYNLRVDVYPAYKRSLKAQSGVLLNSSSEAGCFAHPQNKADLVCGRCGRFMCALCDIELNGEHLCPTCLEKGAAQGRIGGLENRRICHDRIALYVAFWSNLFYFLIPIAAPAVLFMTIRYWKSPLSLVSTTRIRFLLASGIASFQLMLIGFYVLAATGYF